MFRTSRAKLARLPLYCYCLLFLRSARYPQMPRFLQFLREFWPMPLPLMNHSALALFAQRTRIPTSARSIGFCVIWVCISSSSSSVVNVSATKKTKVGGPIPIDNRPGGAHGAFRGLTALNREAWKSRALRYQNRNI